MGFSTRRRVRQSLPAGLAARYSLRIVTSPVAGNPWGPLACCRNLLRVSAGAAQAATTELRMPVLRHLAPYVGARCVTCFVTCRRVPPLPSRRDATRPLPVDSYPPKDTECTTRRKGSHEPADPGDTVLPYASLPLAVAKGLNEVNSAGTQISRDLVPKTVIHLCNGEFRRNAVPVALVAENPSTRVGKPLECGVTGVGMGDIGGLELVRSVGRLHRGVQHCVGLRALLLIQGLCVSELVALRGRPVVHDASRIKGRGRRRRTMQGACSD
jgi:hypothetical protein